MGLGLAPIGIEHSALTLFAAKPRPRPTVAAMTRRGRYDRASGDAGVQISILFRLVRNGVIVAAAGRQEPSWPMRRLEQFYLSRADDTLIGVAVAIFYC
ncbi:MAG: hypothetical protein KGQ48_06055 [Bradyrhizobium sp.]|nr:hypothetical protein [Bradyrhizobium sp.]